MSTRYLLFRIGYEYDLSELKYIREIPELVDAEKEYKITEIPNWDSRHYLVIEVTDGEPIKQHRFDGSAWSKVES